MNRKLFGNWKLGIGNFSSGFTLVELMIVVAILAIIMVIVASNFNSIGIFNKARDAQRKKDLGRIKVAFEEYFNDRGCYPDATMVTSLNLQSSCQTGVFSPWLSNWPCDPNKSPYRVFVDNPLFSGSCSKWYKVMTMLENKLDTNIPSGWSYLSTIVVGNNITSEMVNYGISSPNVNWYDVWFDPECIAYGGCYYNPDPQDAPNMCNSAGTGCIGPNCYVGLCRKSCRVTCCGAGCN